MTRYGCFVSASALVLTLASLGAAKEHEQESQRGAAASSATEGHGASAAHSHAPHVGQINWSEGLLGEDESEEPGLLYRRPGTPPPLLAMVINSGLLFGLLFYFGKHPIAEALRRRREGVMQAMLDAARMKEESSSRLKEYEDRLSTLEEQTSTLLVETRETAEAERKQALAEAEEKRSRLEREAHRLILQETDAARLELKRQAIRRALEDAGRLIAQQVNDEDHRRLADAYLAAVGRAGPSEAGQEPTGVEP